MSYSSQSDRNRISGFGNSPMVTNTSLPDDEKVVPDAPAMRAVAMRSAGPSLVQEAFHEKSGGITYPASGFGKAPSLKPPSKLPSLKPPAMGFSKPVYNAKQMNVKEEWTGVTSPSVWDVKDDSLELVPLDFPLERTHREIAEPASVVSRRISDALRSMSIEAVYDCEKAKAKCKTCDFVGFRIRLFAGSELGQPVIVEIQRRNGSPSSFMKSCRAILCAAEGKSVEDQKPALPPFSKKPIGQMKCLQSLPIPVPSATETARDALQDVVAMMRAHQRDRNILGLENLCSLTDPTKTSPTVSILVSKCVVLGSEEFDIREEIRVLMDRDVFSSDFEVDEDGGMDRCMNRPDHFRHLALNVFTNALQVVSKNESLSTAVSEQKWFTDQFIPSLVEEVRRSSTSTSSAYYATSCLRSLLESSQVARSCVLANDGKQALTEALTFAQMRHDLLAEESNRCLTLLDGSTALVSEA